MSRRGKERWRRASGGSPYVEADDVAVDNGRKADGKSLPVGAVSDRERIADDERQLTEDEDGPYAIVWVGAASRLRTDYRREIRG